MALVFGGVFSVLRLLDFDYTLPFFTEIGCFISCFGLTQLATEYCSKRFLQENPDMGCELALITTPTSPKILFTFSYGCGGRTIFRVMMKDLEYGANSRGTRPVRNQNLPSYDQSLSISWSEFLKTRTHKSFIIARQRNKFSPFISGDRSRLWRSLLQGPAGVDWHQNWLLPTSKTERHAVTAKVCETVSK